MMYFRSRSLESMASTARLPLASTIAVSYCATLLFSTWRWMPLKKNYKLRTTTKRWLRSVLRAIGAHKDRLLCQRKRSRKVMTGHKLFSNRALSGVASNKSCKCDLHFSCLSSMLPKMMSRRKWSVKSWKSTIQSKITLILTTTIKAQKKISHPWHIWSK